jgi:hypothetical protein
VDYAALKQEVTADPLGLGYAARVAAGDDAGVAALLNAAAGPGAAAVAVQSMARGDFLLAIGGAYLALPNLSAAVQAKWDRILAVIRAADAVTVASPLVQNLLALAVADGVLAQADVDAVKTRTGSRAEVLFGAGTAVSGSDVSYALRGTR